MKFYNILDKTDKTDKLMESTELNPTDTENDFLDLVHEKWSNNVGFKPKLRNYSKYKQNNKLQHNQRSLLAHEVKDGNIAPTLRNWTLF